MVRAGREWGPSRTNRRRGRRVALPGALLTVLPATGRAQPAAVKPPRPSQLAAERQTIDGEIVRLRVQVEDMAVRLTAIQEEMKEAEERRVEDQEQLKAMREEVRGLYVESSSTKELIGKLGEQVDGLGAALERFRLGVGVLLAALVVLQGVGVALTFRARS